MGSPLGPTLANLFMGYNEQKWLESDHDRPVKFYRRYVDDNFYLSENKHQALTFLNFFKHSTPEFEYHYRKRAYETTLI